MWRVERTIHSLSRLFNVIAAGGVVLMMVLITADVVFRLIWKPIPGVYDIVGLLGVLVISFALAYTSIEKGHIAVDFIVQKLSMKAQIGVEAVNSFLGMVLFGLVAWRSLVYGSSLGVSGEVSLTIGLPIHWFVYGMGLGCFLLCLVLLLQCVNSLQRLVEN